MQVVLEGIELRAVRMPLAEPFVTAHGTRRHRQVVIVRAVAAEGPAGWREYTAGALHVLEHHLVPRLLEGRSLREVRGHHMAKAALECAALDAGLRAEDRSMAAFLGATRPVVPTGIALGITRTIDGLIESVVRWRDRGHRAFKLKVRPGSGAGRHRAAFRPRRPGGPRPPDPPDRRAGVPRRVDRVAG